MWHVETLAYSVNPRGMKLWTGLLRYPRIIHAEFMTHRVNSRNYQSNRAIPVAKMLSFVETNPFIPLYWGKNQKGMNPGEEFGLDDLIKLNGIWRDARDKAVEYAKLLLAMGVHKGIANRLTEPWQFITGIVSATEWNNFFNLRIDKDAEPHIRHLADMIWEAQNRDTPVPLQPGEWHLPLITGIDKAELYNRFIANGFDTSGEVWDQTLARISTGRVARVSYLTHDGKRDYLEDIRLHNDLLGNGHWSPFEHPAICMDDKRRYGNFTGFKQYRKQFKNENRTKFNRKLVRIVQVEG